MRNVSASHTEVVSEEGGTGACGQDDISRLPLTTVANSASITAAEEKEEYVAAAEAARCRNAPASPPAARAVADIARIASDSKSWTT